MTKKNKKSPPSYKSSYVVIAITLLALASVLAFQYFSPKPVTVAYFVKALDEIGAPEGFVANPQREHISTSAFEQMYARRTYVGEVSFEVLKNQMIQRISDAGFKNVRWREKSDARSEGLVATCKDIHIFVGIQQAGDDPIDIEIIKNGDKNAPDCPTL